MPPLYRLYVLRSAQTEIKIKIVAFAFARTKMFQSIAFSEIDGAFWFDQLDEQTILEPFHGSSTPVEETSLNPSESDPQNLDSWYVTNQQQRRGGRRKRGRGRGRTYVTAEERRLKNREIQARYREKRKSAKEELEASFSQVSNELVDAKVENNEERERNVVLEKVLVLRDAAVNVLEQGKHCFPGNCAQPEKDVGATSEIVQEKDEKIGEERYGANDVLFSLSLSKSVSSEDVSEAIAGEPVGVPAPIVESMYRTLSFDNGGPIQSFAEAYEVVTHLHEAKGDLESVDPSYAFVVSKVKSMSGEQLVQGWRSFALTLRDLLDVHEKDISDGQSASLVNWAYDKPPAVLEQILPLFMEQVVVLSTALRHNVAALEVLFNTASEPCMNSPEKWKELALAMEISPKQRAAVLKHYRYYTDRVAELRSRQISMVKCLQGATIAGQDSVDSGQAVTSLQLMMERYLTLVDSSGRLMANPDSELMAMIELMRETGKVWTTLQKAKLVAMAYPAFPDTVQLMRAVAAMGGGIPSTSLALQANAESPLPYTT